MWAFIWAFIHCGRHYRCSLGSPDTHTLCLVLDNEMWAEVMCATSGQSNLRGSTLFSVFSFIAMASIWEGGTIKWWLLNQPRSLNNYNEQNSPLIHIRATAWVRTFGRFAYWDFGVICYYTTSLISILTNKSTQTFMHLTTFLNIQQVLSTL